MAKKKENALRSRRSSTVGSSPTGPTKFFEIIQAFVFACFGCGKQYATPIPPEGSIVEFICDAEGCGYYHKMTWTGKMWKVSTPGNEQEYSSPTHENGRPIGADTRLVAESGVDAVRKRLERSEGFMTPPSPSDPSR